MILFGKNKELKLLKKNLKGEKIVEKVFNKTSHIEIIKQIAVGLQAIGSLNRYLELGIQKGNCFNKIAPLAKEAYAVDILDNYNLVKENKNLVWFHGKSIDFLNQHDKNKKFDLVFIDADHSHIGSLTDFRTVLPMVSENGLILLHDTYPPSEAFTSPKYCNDTYKTAEYIRKNYKDLESVTLPFFYGLTIVRNLNRQLSWKK
jgi:hypothetical protein